MRLIEQFGQVATSPHVAALHERRVAAPIEQQDALLPLREAIGERRLELVADDEPQPVGRVALGGRVARFARGSRRSTTSTDRQPRLADALGQREQRVLARSSRVHPALEARRRAAEDDDRALVARAHDRHFARVVARRLALLVARLVLLVDDDGAEVASGAKIAERAPTAMRLRPSRSASHSSYRSPSLSALCSTAIWSPNTARKRSTVCGVSAISGTSTIAVFPSLEHDAAEQLDVDERLAAAGDAVQEEHVAGRGRRRALERVALRRRGRVPAPLLVSRARRTDRATTISSSIVTIPALDQRSASTDGENFELLGEMLDRRASAERSR